MNNPSTAHPDARQDNNATAGAAARTGAGAGTGAAAPTGAGGVGPGASVKAVLGPFTIRDLAVFAAGLLLFIASLLPLFDETYNLWNVNNLFALALGILLPLIVVALFVARRLTPGTSLRIGSMSVDQFASVTASYTLGFFFLVTAAAYDDALILGLVGAAVLFAATVLGRFLPFFATDFLNRPEVPAHVAARDSAAPVHKPRPVRTGTPAGHGSRPAASAAASGAAATLKAAAAKTAAAVASVAGKPETANDPTRSDAATGDTARVDAGPRAGSAGSPSEPATAAAPTVASAVVPPHAGAGQDAQATARQPSSASATPATTVNPQVRQQEPIGATVDPASRPEPDEQPTYEAFWFAVAQPRTAVDPRTGAPLFVIEPGGWVLALEDRGNSFLVQHTDGRIGILRDLSNIERG